jgi:hypothetical protein
MKEHQNPGRIAAGRERPFGRHSPRVDRRERYILSYRPNRADLIEALASFQPTGRGLELSSARMASMSL